MKPKSNAQMASDETVGSPGPANAQVPETISRPCDPEEVERQTYTILEAAKIVGICRSLAYRPGVLPTVKIAGRRLVPKHLLERMLGKTA